LGSGEEGSDVEFVTYDHFDKLAYAGCPAWLEPDPWHLPGEALLFELLVHGAIEETRDVDDFGRSDAGEGGHLEREGLDGGGQPGTFRLLLLELDGPKADVEDQLLERVGSQVFDEGRHRGDDAVGLLLGIDAPG